MRPSPALEGLPRHPPTLPHSANQDKATGLEDHGIMGHKPTKQHVLCNIVTPSRLVRCQGHQRDDE